MSRSFRLLTISVLALIITASLFSLHSAPISFAATGQATETGTAVAATPTPTDSLFQRNPIIQSFDGVYMVLVPRGCFKMGTDRENDDEQPITKVCFDQLFWIDRYEVTQ